MGQADPPCEAIITSAAESIGKRLASDGISHLVSSPLQRCVATTRALFPERTPELDSNLQERHLGEWSGKRKTIVQCEQPLAFFPSGALDPRITPPHGETFTAFCQRVVNALSCYAALPSGSRVVVVSHNGVIRCIRYLIEGLTIEEAFDGGEPHLTPREYEWSAKQLEVALGRLKHMQGVSVSY